MASSERRNPRPRNAANLNGLDLPPTPPTSYNTGPDSPPDPTPPVSETTSTPGPPASEPESKQVSKQERKKESKQVSNPADGNRADQDGPPPPPPAQLPQWGVDAILGGGIDPEDEWVPAGWRTLGYVKDAVKLQAATSRNRDERKAQSIVTNALKAYLAPEILDQAYYNRHGRQRPEL